LRDVQKAARCLGQQIFLLDAGSEKDIGMAFAIIVQQQAVALLVGDDPYFLTRREQIIALAARYAIPASYFFIDWVRAGGLMSYADGRSDSIRQAGRYVGRQVAGTAQGDCTARCPRRNPVEPRRQPSWVASAVAAAPRFAVEVVSALRSTIPMKSKPRWLSGDACRISD
jgi:hypothetical protein